MTGAADDGYARYHAFFEVPPLLTIEWRDPETPAVGVLVINSLRGGAAGGGTRMRRFFRAEAPAEVDVAAIREEALFLAKTMEIKFRVSGPDIGGAKSVLHFDPADPRKRDVLRRWFQAIAPYLRNCYGTGGDLNVEMADVVPLTRDAGVAHPQEGVVVGHAGATGERKARIVENLRGGVAVPVVLPDLPGVELKLSHLVTGFGVVEATAAYLQGIGESLAGKRVLVEGFGAAGGPAAYYYHAAGARVVGIVCKEGPDFLWATDPGGLDVPALLAGRREATLLPASCSRGPSPEPFWEMPADCFAPCARSHTVGHGTLDRLRAAGVSILACGANNPFDDPALGDLPVQRRADRELAVLPDFVANCGMARAFAYLMNEPVDRRPEAILADVRATIHRAVGRVLAGETPRDGVLERALAAFVPAR